MLYLHPALAPYKCAVLPLSKKLGEKAMEIRNELSKHFPWWITTILVPSASVTAARTRSAPRNCITVDL